MSTKIESAKRLYEGAGSAAAPAAVTKFGEATGDKYKVRIISAGEGSSGIYPIDMLERDIPAALPIGSRMRANHDGLCEDGGDIRRVISRTVDTPWREGNDMVTNIQVAGQWSEYVREFGDIIGLSISLGGEYAEIPEGGEESHKPGYWVDSAGNEHKREIAHLYSMEESPYNSLDFVEAPGANGRILQALESARGHLAELNVREQASFAGDPFTNKLSEAAPPRKNEEDIEMDEQTLRQILAEHESKVLAKVAEASKPAEPTPSEKPSTRDIAEAIVTSGLTEPGRAAVYEAVDAGTPVAEAIEKIKAHEAAVKAALEANQPQRGAFFGAGSALPQEALDSELDSMLGV